MAKPIRLNKDLMADAERQAALAHRSVPKQIEYWASLGRLVADNLRPTDSLALLQGFLTLKVEPQEADALDMDSIWDDLEADRGAGVLANQVTGSPVRYGIDPDKPNRLIAIDEQGTKTVSLAQQRTG